MNGYAGAKCDVGPVGILKGFAKPRCAARAKATRSTSSSSLDRSRLKMNATASRTTRKNKKNQRQVRKTLTLGDSPAGVSLIFNLSSSVGQHARVIWNNAVLQSAPWKSRKPRETAHCSSHDQIVGFSFPSVLPSIS